MWPHCAQHPKYTLPQVYWKLLNYVQMPRGHAAVPMVSPFEGFHYSPQCEKTLILHVYDHDFLYRRNFKAKVCQL